MTSSNLIMENIKNIIQNTQSFNPYDNIIIENYQELENANLGGSDQKIYHDLDFYKKLTNKQKDIVDSEAIRELDKGQKVKSIFLSGESGIGKTTQAILAMRDYILEFYEKNQKLIEYNKNQLFWNSPTYFRYNDILELLNQRKFGNDEQKSNAYYQFTDMRECEFLVIDDFSCKKSGSKSEWLDNEIDKLFQDIFEFRYGNSKNNITIITSNDTKEDMQNLHSSWLSNKTYSRLLASCVRYARSNKTKDLRN
jgi:DNA replication protein DnaC